MKKNIWDLIRESEKRESKKLTKLAEKQYAAERGIEALEEMKRKQKINKTNNNKNL
jgi:hypothetical protein